MDEHYFAFKNNFKQIKQYDHQNNNKRFLLHNYR